MKEYDKINREFLTFRKLRGPYVFNWPASSPSTVNGTIAVSEYT